MLVESYFEEQRVCTSPMAVVTVHVVACLVAMVAVKSSVFVHYRIPAKCYRNLDVVGMLSKMLTKNRNEIEFRDDHVTSLCRDEDPEDVPFSCGSLSRVRTNQEQMIARSNIKSCSGTGVNLVDGKDLLFLCDFGTTVSEAMPRFKPPVPKRKFTALLWSAALERALLCSFIL